MKLTCVTAVFNAIKSGNRENLIRCVRSVAALKTEHEHLIYDGGSTDGTVELLRELEREVNGGVKKRGGESRWTAEGMSPDCCAREGTRTTGGGESGAREGTRTTGGGESRGGESRVGESGARGGTRTTGGGESHGIDRRACAERKVAEWLAGVDEAAFEAALVKLVEEKTAAGEYRFKKPEERELALEGARKFYREFARKIVPLSDGRYVYFAPDERAKTRNASNAISWAEYAFHAVSSSGKLLDGKNFRERLYNRTKAADLPFLEGVIRNEHCMYRLIDAYPENDAVIFIGQDDANGRLEVVTRLDRFGNAEANLGEVTVIAKHKRKENPPPKFRPLTEVVETVAKHQAAGFSPSTTRDSIANGLGSDKGGDEKKLPRLVPLTEAVRTVVSHQTATGSYPPNEISIANPRGDDKGGGEKSEKCEVRSEKFGAAEGERSTVDAFVSNASDGIEQSYVDAIGTIASTGGDESGARGARALPGGESSAIHHSSFSIHHSPTLRVVSEPDTGIYNALNKGVRDAKGEWFYVLGCDMVKYAA